MSRPTTRIILSMAVLGLLVPFALLGLNNLRTEDPQHPTAEQRLSASLMPVLYPGSVFLGAMIGIEEGEPRYRREFVKWGSLSLVANVALYAVVGCLVAGVRALLVRRKRVTL